MRPVKLTIENFYSHGKSEVDFTLFNSALIIGSIDSNYDTSNGSGKSALLGSILWCLFNKSSAQTMDDIIRWGETTCQVVFEFDHRGDRFRISRQRNRIYGTSQVELERLKSDGEWQKLNKSTAGQTNKEIETILGIEYETFINSAYFRQNDISEFAEANAAKRKDILKRIIDVSRWDDYEKAAKKKISEIQIEKKILSSLVEEGDRIITDKQQAELDLKEAQGTLDSQTQERSDIENSIETLTREYSKIKESLDTEQWDRLTDENTLLKQEGLEGQKKLDGLKNEYTKYKKDVSTYEQDVSQKQETISKIKIVDDLDLKISEIQDQSIKHQSQQNASELFLQELRKKKIVEDECYVCKQGIDQGLYDHLVQQHGSEMKEHEGLLEKSKAALLQLKSSTSEVKKAQAEQKLHSELSSQIENLKIKIDLSQGAIDSLTSDIKIIINKLKSIQEKIDSNSKVLSSLKDDGFQKLHHQIEDLRIKKAALDSKIESGNRSIGVMMEKVSGLEHKILELNKTRKEISSLDGKDEVFDNLRKLFGKGGIQTILLNSVIEDLEETSNQIISSICNEPFSIILETQRTHSDGVSIVETLDLRVRKDGVIYNFKSLSGGEQFRVSLAIRIALSEISSRRGGSSLEFLLLDEVNSPLDRSGTEKLFANVIKSLESRYKILVITHDDALKERFNHIIEVSKINGISSVAYTTR